MVSAFGSGEYAFFAICYLLLLLLLFLRAIFISVFIIVGVVAVRCGLRACTLDVAEYLLLLLRPFLLFGFQTLHFELLILDEPTNGLDPQGIKELRDILKELAHKEGTCVVVSSHLMSEMEMMCDRVGIIANGKMIGSYTMEELISQSDSSIAEYVLEVDDPQKAMGLIKLADEGKRIDKETGAVVLSIPAEIEKKKIASVNKTLIEGGVSLYTVHRRENKKLEDVFIELTGGKEGGVQIG